MAAPDDPSFDERAGRPRDDDDRPRNRRSDEDEYDDRPRRRRKGNDFEATDFLVPSTHVSAWSLISCYFGLFGMCLPGIGLVFTIPGLICGVVALRKRKKPSTYGRVTSDIRAILGIIFSTLGIFQGVGFFVLLAFAK